MIEAIFVALLAHLEGAKASDPVPRSIDSYRGQFTEERVDKLPVPAVYLDVFEGSMNSVSASGQTQDANIAFELLLHSRNEGSAKNQIIDAVKLLDWVNKHTKGLMLVVSGKSYFLNRESNYRRIVAGKERVFSMIIDCKEIS